MTLTPSISLSFVLLLSSVAYANNCTGVGKISNVMQWHTVAEPVLEYKELESIYSRNCVFYLEISTGGPIVHTKKDDAYSKIKLPFKISFSQKMMPEAVINKFRVINGWIVAVDQGEFAGESKWYSLDGKDDSIVAREPIIWLFPFDDKYVALSGTPASYKYGGAFSILSNNKDNNQWIYRKLFEFETKPVAAVPYSKIEYIVLTMSGLYLINIDDKTKKIIDNSKWVELNPSSLVVYGKDIYIGLSDYVLRLVQSNSGFRREWLKPRERIEDKLKCKVGHVMRGRPCKQNNQDTNP